MFERIFLTKPVSSLSQLEAEDISLSLSPILNSLSVLPLLLLIHIIGEGGFLFTFLASLFFQLSLDNA
jgi:hypothetical protein